MIIQNAINFKKKTFRFVLIVFLGCLLVLTIVAESQKSFKQTADVKDVRAALDKLVNGFNSRDAAAVLSSFAEDGYIINPTRGVGDYKGLSESLQKAYAVPSKNPYTVLVNVEEIQTSGDLAFVRLIWLRENNADKQIISKEKDVEIWQKQKDGKWKLARGYSYYFKEDFPLTPVTALARTERAADKSEGKKTGSNQAKDVEAIKSALDKLVASYNNRDLETTMLLYAPDSLLSHDGVADTNREQARQAYAKRFANPPPFPITISYQVEEIQSSGDLAFARLNWLVERNSDKKILSRNKDLEIWQRQTDGSWKLARGIGFYLKPDESGIQESVKAANQNFMNAFARGDGTEIGKLYTENAQLLQPNGEIINGRERIRKYWQSAIDSGLKQIKLETLEVTGTEENAAEVGRYSVFDGKGNALDKGKYIVLWKKENGKLMLDRDIWNSNLPAANK